MQQMTYQDYSKFAIEQYDNSVEVVRLRIPQVGDNGAVVDGQDEFDRDLQGDQHTFVKDSGGIDVLSPIQVKVLDLITREGVINEFSPWLDPQEVNSWITGQRSRPQPPIGRTFDDAPEQEQE